MHLGKLMQGRIGLVLHERQEPSFVWAYFCLLVCVYVCFSLLRGMVIGLLVPYNMASEILTETKINE